jgi:ABC-type phosphate transport system substrate-binding protein
MSSRFKMASRARLVALAVGAGALCSFAMADTSMAAAPTAGSACQTDGKINGRGATFQTNATRALIDGYRIDVCGPVGSGGDAGTNMLAYNYASATGNTGSGNGQKAASCRTDAFAGTDIPYDQATLAQLNGAPGATGSCGITFTPPFQPNAPLTFPDPADVQANVMSFPVAGSSVALPVNLQAADCGGTKPASLQFSVANVSKIFGGDIANWNDPRLVAENASLTNCNVAITRVVRLDKSGTTQVFKNFLSNADGARSGATCDAANSWTNLALDSNNTAWPTGAGCSNLVRPTTTGGAPVVSLVRSTPGAVGYADLADAVVAGTPALIQSNVRNATDTQYVGAANGTAANCDFATSLPGSTNSDAVGLNPGGDNWAFDAATRHDDVTFKGSQYPICGLTFGLVYTGLNGNSGTGAIARLSANQRRTLYSYFTYVFSPAGQSRLNAARYAALPAAFLTKLRLGFQTNF